MNSVPPKKRNNLIHKKSKDMKLKGELSVAIIPSNISVVYLIHDNLIFASTQKQKKNNMSYICLYRTLGLSVQISNITN